jgi:hypothetical protein
MPLANNVQHPSMRRYPRPAGPPAFDLHTESDQRQDIRYRTCCEMWLTDLDGGLVLHCSARDVSSGGAFALVSNTCGLAAGQRYLVHFSRRSGDGACRFLQPCPATVVRTQLHCDDNGEHLGVALQFDQRFSRPGLW